MPDSDNARLLDAAPDDTRFIYVRDVEEMNELAALDADKFETLTNKWHGRK